MRDLKHLIYFENLLQEANNDLVKQAKSDGKLALGYTCYFMPEVLLDLPGCVSVRLRAPRCTSPDMATYYMSSRTCHYGRSLLERALEGGFNFLDAQLATETCTVTCRFQEHLQRMDIIQNEPPLAVAIRCYCCCFLCKIGVERLFAVKFRHQRNFRVSVSHPHFPSPYFQLRCFLFSHRTLSP